MPPERCALRVRAVEHARGFVDGAEKSEGARDEAHVVVDGFRYADNGERVAPAARLLVELVRTALCPVAATALPISTGPREVPRIVPPF
jgi:hypothetical protein